MTELQEQLLDLRLEAIIVMTQSASKLRDIANSLHDQVYSKERGASEIYKVMTDLLQGSQLLTNELLGKNFS